MSNFKIPRWFGYAFLLMLALRFAYKYYRSQQKPAYETRMAELETRNQKLIQAIQANKAAQRAAGARVVLADTTAGAMPDTTRPAARP